MGEILLSSYELTNTTDAFQKDPKTHITTNLNAQELEEKYGERVRSRMRAMFNLFAFDETATDKRK